MPFPLALAIALSLAGAAGTSINQLNLAKEQRKIADAGAAEEERLAQEGRQVIRDEVEQVTPESQNERQEVRDAQNIASIIKTRQQAAEGRPSGGVGTKGNISEATIKNRLASAIGDKQRQADRTKSLGEFFSLSQNTPDNILPLRSGRQLLNQSALSRRGNANVTDTNIRSLRPNDAVAILSNIASAVGMVGGLASGAPAAASAGAPVNSLPAATAFTPFLPTAGATVPAASSGIFAGLPAITSAAQNFAQPAFMQPRNTFNSFASGIQ